MAGRNLIFAYGTVSLQCRSSLISSENNFEDIQAIKETRKQSFLGDNNDIGDIEGRVQSCSGRQLRVETDIHRAFAGVARQLRRSLRSDLCHGLPSCVFDWLWLWQPLKVEAPQRSIVAPSWSWTEWHRAAWSRIWDWYTRDMKVVRRDIRKRTWIVWYQREGHESTRCEPVGRHGKETEEHDKNFYSGKMRKEQRFHAIDCSVTVPTPRTLTGEGLSLYTDGLISENPGSGFLQFRTESATFELRLIGTGNDGVYGQRVPGQQSDSSGSLVLATCRMTPPVTTTALGWRTCFYRQTTTTTTMTTV